MQYLGSVKSSDLMHVVRYVRFGCFGEGVADFDAAAFRLASGEACAMDPQARIALEQTQVRELSSNAFANLIHYHLRRGAQCFFWQCPCNC